MSSERFVLFRRTMTTAPDPNTSVASPHRRLRERHRRVADVLVDMLAARGVDVVFGLPGGTIAPVFDALIDHPEIRVVTVKHEAGAMFAAAGYARTTGKLGVVLVTSGPGVLNAMTGLASAHCDGIPILVLAGEVSRETFGRGALQEGSAYFLNVVQMTRHISKLALEIPEPSAAPATLRRAIATAMSGRRGPVVVTLPLDVTRSTIQVPEISQGVSTRFELDEGAVVLAANALAKSRSKVIFAGSGVRAGRGPELLRAVAERLDCPVMTTPKAKGVFPEDHRLALGVFGMGGHPSTQAYLEAGVEAVLAIGTSLGDLATNGWSPLLDASRVFVHVDIDASQIGRAYPANVAIAAPAEVFFDQLLARVPAAETTQAHCVRRHAPTATATPGKIAPHTAIAELQAVLPRDAIYTVDSGEHYFFATHFLEITHPDSFFVMTGLGAMGSSIGAAIGAQLARPDRRVVVLCGDGGFAMAAGDVATAAAHELPITFVVFDDRRLGMVELGNLAIFGRTPSYPAGPVDVAGLGRALGADSAVIDGPGQLLTHPALRSPGRRPLVLDVLVDESVRMPKHGRFEALGAKR